jgi:putative spermidine/putrescine transport system substrate-binding protein
MRTKSPTRRRGRRLGTAIAVASIISLSACGGGGSDTSSGPPKKLGDDESKLSILAWPGYVEDGSNDPKVDWVTPFEKETGCKVTSKVYGTSDEAFNLTKTGDYDVIAASGDLTARMVASKEAAEVNTDLIPNYAKVYPFLKDRDWNTFNGKHYGVPHGYGANLLMYNADKVKPAPTSWKAVFGDGAKYKGKVTAYDSPIYIADAALYLMKHQPDLGIKNPYALDDKQFAATVQLLKGQRKNVGEYWADYLKSASAFESGNSLVGTTWQVIVNTIDPKKVKVKAILPEEGATGWSDTWMISSKAKSPNCAYAWLNYIASPKTNAQVTEYFGEAPNSQEACKYASDPSFCKTYKAGDKEFESKLWYWQTPVAKCVDGRTDVKCKDYADWTKAWTEIKG